MRHHRRRGWRADSEAQTRSPCAAGTAGEPSGPCAVWCSRSRRTGHSQQAARVADPRVADELSLTCNPWSLRDRAQPTNSFAHGHARGGFAFARVADEPIPRLAGQMPVVARADRGSTVIRSAKRGAAARGSPGRAPATCMLTASTSTAHLTSFGEGQVARASSGWRSPSRERTGPAVSPGTGNSPLARARGAGQASATS